jgi:hypothetical protein
MKKDIGQMSWPDTVKYMWNTKKHTAGYKFKNALMDAKKIYRGGKSSTKKSKKSSSRKMRKTMRKK